MGVVVQDDRRPAVRRRRTATDKLISEGTPAFRRSLCKVFWHEEQPAPMRLTGERLDGPAAPVQINGGPETGGPSIVTFPAPGCWRLRAEADAQTLDATVYVYPWGCRPENMRGDPPPSPQLCSPP